MYSERLMINHVCVWLKTEEKGDVRKEKVLLRVMQSAVVSFTYDSQLPAEQSRIRHLMNFRFSFSDKK